MSAPVPHRGLEGEGIALVSQAKKLLEAAIQKPGLGAETDIGQAILKSLTMLGKAIPEGTIPPGMQTAGIQQFMMQQRQQAPLTNILAALQGGGGGGAPAPSAPPGGGAPATPPGPIPS